jgi:hypothetical protein
MAPLVKEGVRGRFNRKIKWDSEYKEGLVVGYY